MIIFLGCLWGIWNKHSGELQAVDDASIEKYWRICGFYAFPYIYNMIDHFVSSFSDKANKY